MAREAGESLTQSIIRALEERLERLRGRRAAPDVARQILRVSERCRPLPDLDPRPADEILGYGPDGTFERARAVSAAGRTRMTETGASLPML